jgi:hypothetical protein
MTHVDSSPFGTYASAYRSGAPVSRKSTDSCGFVVVREYV